MSNDKMTGKITKLSEKGWGFITSVDKPFTRIFFHWSGLTQTTLNFTELKLGMKVDFELLSLEDKGYRAIKISVINHEPTTTIPCGDSVV